MFLTLTKVQEPSLFSVQAQKKYVSTYTNTTGPAVYAAKCSVIA